MEEAKREFYQKVHFWGRVTIAVGIAGSLLFPAYLTFIKGWNPGIKVLGAALVIVAAAVGHTWVNPATLITQLLILGPAGTYIGNLSGNIQNMRVPSSIAGQSSVGAKRGSVKADISGTVAVVASVIVNTSFLVALVLVGAALVQTLPTGIRASFAFVTPAIFGAVFGQFACMSFPNAVGALLIATPFIFFLRLPEYIETPFTVVATIFLGVYLHRRANRVANSMNQQQSV